MDLKNILKYVIIFAIVLITFATAAAVTGFQKGERGGLNYYSGNFSNLNFPSGIDEDALGQCLDNYMESVVSSSPLIGYGRIFVQAGKQYNVNPALMVAIGQQESALGTAGIVRDHPYNYYGLTTTGGGWAEFGSWEEAINNHARYLRENYLDQNLTTIQQIGAKYAPVGAGNDPNNLNSNWVTGVQSHFDEIVEQCPILNQEPFLASSCTSNYTGPAAEPCGWIELPDDPSYVKYGDANEHWGKTTLINMVIAVSRSWNEKGHAKLNVGELSGMCAAATGHASHDRGTDVDIDIPNGMMENGSTPDSNYDPRLAVELAKMFIACGATDIGYEDPQVIQEVNTWAKQNGYVGQIYGWTGHKNHFHVRIEKR